jgi:hypothetical protein
MRVIPTPYRILALMLLLLAGIAFGYVQGISRESDRRDSQDAQKERADHKAFMDALANGKTHAANALEWQRKSRIYYLNWKESLNNETDTNLAYCKPSQGGVHAALLSGTWVGLYNAAWLPELDAQGHPGGAAAEVTEAGTATPREVLDNVAINAASCGEDRKRLDELIDHLNETGAQ